MLTCKLCGHSTTMIHNRCFELEVKRLSKVYVPIEPTCPNKAIPANPRSYRYRYDPISAEVRRGIKRQKPRCKNRDKGIYTHLERSLDWWQRYSGRGRLSHTTLKPHQVNPHRRSASIYGLVHWLVCNGI